MGEIGKKETGKVCARTTVGAHLEILPISKYKSPTLSPLSQQTILPRSINFYPTLLPAKQNQIFTKKSQFCLQKNLFQDVRRNDHFRFHTSGEVEKARCQPFVAQPEGRQRQDSELEEEEQL